MRKFRGLNCPTLYTAISGGFLKREIGEWDIIGINQNFRPVGNYEIPTPEHKATLLTTCKMQVHAAHYS